MQLISLQEDVLLPDQFEKHKKKYYESSDFVKQAECFWPVRKAEELALSAEQKRSVDSELKQKVKEAVTILVQEEPNLEKVIDPARYSTFTKLVRCDGNCEMVKS